MVRTHTFLSHRTMTAVAPLTLDTMASATKASRNRAVDAYRALAMLAVAASHWIVMVAYRDNGQLVSGNGLTFVEWFRPLTWMVQVMPLFFLVGGFASAASLDSRGMGLTSTPAERSTWIAGRLARLLPPVKALAVTWLVALVVGYAAGAFDLVVAAAYAAAVPLWFLANYTADVVLAPHFLPLFRRSPRLVAGISVGLFLGLEAVNVIWAHPIRNVNWILGWFLFQVAGFAWKDGLLPTGRVLLGCAGGLWATAAALVAFGPWSVSMVNFEGVGLSPTHPPTLALLVFGAAQGATAIYCAPRLTRWLEHNPPVWKAVIGANSVAMTIYLWHMTAGVASLAILDFLGLLGTSAPATFGWWLAKVPFVLLAMIVMAVTVPPLARIERNALLAPKPDWAASPVLLLAGAALTSAGLKAWTSGQLVPLVAGLILVIVADRALVAANNHFHRRYPQKETCT